MKKIIALSFMFAALAACSSDDSPSDGNPSHAEPDYKQLILGKWYFVGRTENGGPLNAYIHDCPSQRDYEEYKSNGEGGYVGHNTACEVDEQESGLYEIKGNILKIKDTDAFPLNAEYTITTLTESELVLTSTSNEPGGQLVTVHKYTKI